MRSLLAVFFSLIYFSAGSFAADAPSGAAILQDLKSFREMGSVLYVAAHPDDENTQLITYLARGRGYRTAYLSITRGDGGQNVLGPEFGEQLGVIRTQELLAARRLDGGRQFFTRAIDFGFSKNPTETLSIWDRPAILGDVVRVIRTFRPDVVIARFSPTAGNTHGHHTASAILALEAFKLAGDPNAYPEQLDKLTVWQPKRIFQNSGGRGGDDPKALRIEIGGNDPVLGESFGSIAARSRGMHKTQGFGNFGGGPGGGGGGPRNEGFTLLDGEPATKDILDGVDTTWARVAGGAEVVPLINDAIEKFNADDLSKNVPALLAVKAKLATVTPDPIVDEKRAQLDRIIQACLGLTVQTGIANPEVVPGEEMKLTHTATISSDVPVKWVATKYPSISRDAADVIELHANRSSTRESTQTLPANTPLSQPYWLRDEPATGTYRVSDPALIGRPENPPAFPIEHVFEVGGQRLTISDEPVQSDSKEKFPRRLDVIPPVSLQFASEVRLFAPGATKTVEVEVTAYRPAASGTLALDAPSEWKVSPASQGFNLEKVGDKTKLSFNVTAPAQAASANIGAHAEVSGGRFASGRIEIRYDHIPLQLLQPPAKTRAVALDMAIRGKQIAYLPGAGDNVAECLEQMGYTVTQISGSDLTAESLKRFDAVVIGVRAFNVRTDLAPQTQALFDYAEAGGNVIVQYNRPNGLKTNKLAPFDLRLSDQRVTDERAAVTFLAPDHPALNTPNKIAPADFDGWVQERGIYFPNQWADAFTPILACSDPNEDPLKGGLLIAKCGKGYYVYTGLVWFRELPAGVPGAYRLFANLVSLGK